MTTLDDMLDELGPEDRAHVEVRASQLIMEERALQTLRKARRMSQARMAELLHIGQDSVSRLERRSDLLISTLRSYVEAMGGTLKLMVDFPGQPSLALDRLDMKAVKAVNRSAVLDVPLKCLPAHASSKPQPHANVNATVIMRADVGSARGVLIAVGHEAADPVRRAHDHVITIDATLGTPVLGRRGVLDSPGVHSREMA